MMYADDHDDRFPPTIVGQVSADKGVYDWPNYINYRARPSASGLGYTGALYPYLGEALPEVEALMCPWAPGDRLKYQKAYMNLGTDAESTTMTSYNFLWGGYEFPTIGFMGAQRSLESGDRDLILSDVMNYRADEGWLLSHRPKGKGRISKPRFLRGAYDELWWSKASSSDVFPEISINAGYADGHVESIRSDETVNAAAAGAWEVYIPLKWK